MTMVWAVVLAVWFGTVWLPALATYVLERRHHQELRRQARVGGLARHIRDLEIDIYGQPMSEPVADDSANSYLQDLCILSLGPGATGRRYFQALERAERSIIETQKLASRKRH